MAADFSGRTPSALLDEAHHLLRINTGTDGDRMTGRLKVGQRVERNGRRGMIAALYVDRVRVNMDSAPYREDWPSAWAREYRV